MRDGLTSSTVRGWLAEASLAGKEISLWRVTGRPLRCRPVRNEESRDGFPPSYTTSPRPRLYSYAADDDRLFSGACEMRFD